jgi:hypothetical protein
MLYLDTWKTDVPKKSKQLIIWNKGSINYCLKFTTFDFSKTNMPCIFLREGVCLRTIQLPNGRFSGNDQHDNR